MVQSKDEHIRLIMQKAQQDRRGSSIPRVASSTTSVTSSSTFSKAKSRSSSKQVDNDSLVSSKTTRSGLTSTSRQGASTRSPYKKDTQGASTFNASSPSLAQQTRMPRTRSSQYSVPRTDPYKSKLEEAAEQSQQSSGASQRVSQNGKQSVEPLKTTSKENKPTEARSKSSAKVVDEEVKKTPPRANQDSKGRAKKVAIQKSEKAKKKVETESEAHIWISLPIFFVAIYLILSTVSYLVYWELDADLASFSSLFSSQELEALNWGGHLGATVSDLLIGKWLGVMGVLLPIVVFTIGLITLRGKSKSRMHYLWSALALMLVGSLAFGHFAGYDSEVFGSGLGGESGIYLSHQLSLLIGYQGGSLLMIFLIIAVLYFAFSVFILKTVSRLDAYLKFRAEKRKVEQALAREKELQRLEAMKHRSLELAEQRLLMEQERAGKEDELAEAFQAEQNCLSEQISSENQSFKRVDSEASVVADLLQSVGATTISSLLLLEGGQYGYIMGYMEDQTPYYYYLDLSLLTVMYPTQFAATPVSNPVGVNVLEQPKKAEEVDTDDLFLEVVEAAKEVETNEEVEDIQPVENPDEEQVQKPKSVEFTVVDTRQNSDEVAVITEESNGNVQESNSIQAVDNKEVKTDVNEEPQKTEGLDLEITKVVEEKVLSNSAIDSMQPYDPTADLKSYKKPSVSLLRDYNNKVNVTQDELNANKDRIEHTLSTFGIKISSIVATIGPTVTLYEIVPAPGVRISKIKNLEDDIALTLSALGIRIIAPIPGKGTIGIEVPNREKEVVSMHSVVCAVKFQNFKAELPIALGKTIQNETFVFDLAKMPHLLVAGATGQGKSVGLNAIITSLLYKKHPSELKFVLVDPKKVELTLYSKLEKHFLAKMEGEDEAIITDTQKVVYTLNSICVEMDSRYDLLKAAEVRNIVEYNEKFKQRRLNPEKGHRFLPYFVVVVDEFADLIMTAGREIETPIARIAQLARAVGIHLIIATQRPTTNIITGVIKANFPARIAFRVTSMVDSRTILDTPGANQLIGKGDMLVSTGSELTRVQCAFVDTPEVAEIVGYIADQRGYSSAYELPEYSPEGEQNGATPSRMIDPGKRDVLFDEVARFVVSTQQGSASIIQRKFSIGFARAGRLVDQLEAAGVVGHQEGSKARQVLIQDPISLEMVLDTND